MKMTVSWEDKIEGEYERKRLKYQEHAKDYQQNGSKPLFFAVEEDVDGLLVSPSGEH